MAEKLAFRAHARLLTMLGDQLIKNERIALVELVKNAYDADATKVLVDFRGFGPDFEIGSDSAMVVTDNGSGMTENTVRTAWMSPATPIKAISKRQAPTTPKGRVLQGEKGIGRFAAFKLGSQVSLVTRGRGQQTETTLLVDISELDETPESDDQRVEFYLDDVVALLEEERPLLFTGHGKSPGPHGTQLEIRGLRAPWTRSRVHDAFDDLDRLQPLMWGRSESRARPDFEVVFLKDGSDLRLGDERTEHFEALLDKAVLRVTDGRFDPASREYRFDLNGRGVTLDLDGTDIRGLSLFKRGFLKDDKGHDLPSSTRPEPACGPFGFEFFVFDLAPGAPAQYQLDADDGSLVRSHRTYLYRDGIRVYPYGDPQDDWLEIDAIRGTRSARTIFSNDQLVGYVTITQSENRALRDKTNREGLLESGRATRDFVVLIQVLLEYLRAKPYAQYSVAKRRARERALSEYRIDRHIESLRADFRLPQMALEQLDALEVAVGSERELWETKLSRMEQLAGVGLSVETASHDLILAGTESLRLSKHIVADLRLMDLAREPVYTVATTLVTQLEFVSERFRDVQGLFVSTRQKQTDQDVIRVLRRVRTIYARLHESKQIAFDIDSAASLKARSTDAAVLQCLINLVDNATYWLMDWSRGPRIIRAFTLDAHTLVLTDSGPGISEHDESYIFEPFYSGKGEEGKGLGLYIARQNGLRNGFSIELEHTGDERELPGATFVVRFGEAEALSVDS